MAGNDLLVVKLGGGEGLDQAAACDDLAGIAKERPLDRRTWRQRDDESALRRIGHGSADVVVAVRA